MLVHNARSLLIHGCELSGRIDRCCPSCLAKLCRRKISGRGAPNTDGGWLWSRQRRCWGLGPLNATNLQRWPSSTRSVHMLFTECGNSAKIFTHVRFCAGIWPGWQARILQRWQKALICAHVIRISNCYRIWTNLPQKGRRLSQFVTVCRKCSACVTPLILCSDTVMTCPFPFP